MEGQRNTMRVRMRAWTPASGYSSPPSPVSSQLSWDEGKDEDFLGQMDENGIIGLRETQGKLQQEDEVVLEEEEDMFSVVRTPEPNDGPPTALVDLSCRLSELLDSEPLSQPIGDDVGYSVSLEDWNDDDDDDDDHHGHGEKLEEEDHEVRIPVLPSRPDRDLILGIKNKEIQEFYMHRDKSYLLQRNIDHQDNWMNNHDDTRHEGKEDKHKSDIAILEHRTPSQNSCDEKSHVSSSPSFKSASRTHNHPYFRDPKLQEEARDCRIEAETFHEPGGSNSGQLSHSPRTYPPVSILQDGKPASALGVFKPENGSTELEQKSAGPRQNHHQLHISTPRDIRSTPQMDFPSSSPAQSLAKDSTGGGGCRRHQRPSKTSHTDPNDVRKGQLSHPLPDFSKVEPRVRFPKSSYKPPKSRQPPHKEDSKPQAPVVFKSPADIVREALLSSSEGPSDTQAPTNSQRPLNTTTPEEFQCSLQATTLVQQLQDDYNRLLMKYAEAENTIDRLRLDAKVYLHSDPPKPSQLVLSGVLKEGSKVMTLSFPQSQRAEVFVDAVKPSQQRLSSATRGTPTHPSSVESFSSSRCESPAATPLTEALSKQMARFQLQVNEFENLLKSQRLNPFEQMQRLSQLAHGQESIERSYLSAQEKHQQLQKHAQGKSGPFDPNRELESLIFQSGIQLEELKEWIEQLQHNQLIEPTPSNPPHAIQPCVSLKETEPQPENPTSAADAVIMFSLEVSSVSGESDGDREEGEDDMHPSVLRSLTHKHQRGEKDFSNLMDHYQNFRDFSKLLDQAEVNHSSLDLRALSPHPAITDRVDNEQQWRNKDEQDSNEPLKQLPMADSLSGLSCISHVCNSMETLPEASVPVSALSRKQGSGSIKSHSSLGEKTAMGRRAFKETGRALRAQLQDGVVTPETDSGFVGSESSRLTPAEHSPVQQRAAVRAMRPSVTQEKCQINPRSPAHTQPSLDPSRAHDIASGGTPGSSGRRGEAKMRHIPSSSTSSSPLCWPSTPLQPWPSSELEQQTRSLSEDVSQQGNRHTKLSSEDPSYLRKSSLIATKHHDDNLKAQRSEHLANHHQAIDSLQAEVHRLKEHLEGTLRTTTPSHRVRAPLSASKEIRDRTLPPTYTRHPRQREFRSLARKTASKREPPDNGGTVKGTQEQTIPRRRSVSVPRLRPESDTSTDSEHIQSEDTTSRHIPASPVMVTMTRRARAETGRSPKTHTYRRTRSISSDRSDVRNDRSEGRGRPAPLCLSCLAQRNKNSGCQARNISSPSSTCYYLAHCPLCGATKREKVPPPVNKSTIQKETRPVRSSHMQPGGVYLAVAPPPAVIGSVLHCVPVCPPVLYYSSPVVSASYQKPFYISPSKRKGYMGHRRRSHSVDTQHSLNRSLGHAVTTASSLREMSQRLVHSLSSGPHHMRPLAKSCTY